MYTMKNVIEELIEESYLLTLSDTEIDAELDWFSQVSEKTVIENIQDIGKRKRILRRLAIIQSVLRKTQHNSRNPIRFIFRGDREARGRREDTIESVVRVKRATIEAIENSEPQLVPLLEYNLAHQSRFAHFLCKQKEIRPGLLRSQHGKPMLIVLLALAAIALFLSVVGR